MKTKSVTSHSSSLFNIDANLFLCVYLGAVIVLGYLVDLSFLSLIVTIVIICMEKSKLVRFVLTQYLFTGVFVLAVGILLGLIGVIIPLLLPLMLTVISILGIVFTVFHVIAIFYAYQWQMFYYPVLGNMIEKIIK